MRRLCCRHHAVQVPRSPHNLPWARHPHLSAQEPQVAAGVPVQPCPLPELMGGALPTVRLCGDTAAAGLVQPLLVPGPGRGGEPGAQPVVVGYYVLALIGPEPAAGPVGGSNSTGAAQEVGVTVRLGTCCTGL